MTDEIILKIRNLHKSYNVGINKVLALQGINFEVKKGEFVSIMGPSGSGKSTLMNLIGCLDHPTHGDIFIDEIRVSTMDAVELAHIRNKNIGFVFQSYNLLHRLNSLENVELPLMYAGVPRYTRHRIALKMLESMNLRHRAFHQPAEMSGGECQRVAIARALINQPAIILADEPTGNLDSKTSLEIMKIFQDLNDAGTTIVMITHDAEVSNYTKRIIHVKDGQLLSDEKVEQKKI